MLNYPGSARRFALDRLTATTSGSFGGDTWFRFGYNALDNLTKNQLAGVKDYAQYVYDGNNRLTQIKNTAGTAIVTLAYDVQGNLSAKAGKGYVFDYGNRLHSTNEEYYRYDATGRRVLKWRTTEPGVLSIYGDAGQLLYDENLRADTRKSTRYVYLAGSLIATRTYGFDSGQVATQYQHTDALGSPVATTNESAQVIERTQWEPYGAAIGKPSMDGYGYTGHIMDGATGLIYMQQRYYDPNIGRFLSVDPVTAYEKPMTNFNRYVYALNNPYKFTDPDGRDITCTGGSCTLVPIGGGLPTVTFPRPEGFPGRISEKDSTFHHVYRFADSAGRGDAGYGQRVNNQLVQNPTPMPDKPATLQGNKIDVNADNAISRLTGQDNVMSYQVPLHGGGSAVLNVTTGDHAATWGIVLRTVEAGPGGSQNIITYGEGNSFLQRTFDPNNTQSREVWTQSAEEITRKAQRP